MPIGTIIWFYYFSNEQQNTLLRRASALTRQNIYMTLNNKLGPYLGFWIFCMLPFLLHAQSPTRSENDYSELYKKSPSGLFSLGMRTTISTFSDNSWSNTGLGAGGAFRLQFAKFLNTEWFFDYLSSDIQQVANRNDYHIGWSVMFYPLAGNADFSKVMKPYILAGHCFDYTYVSENADPSNYAKRWSGAMQAGLGTHINLTPRFDISILGQYMIHLGNDIHADIHNGEVHIEKQKGASLEGHLLFTIGVYYKIVDLW